MQMLEQLLGGDKMNFTAEMARKWLILFDEKIQAKQDYLSELDTPIGDGDHGHNMARGMSAVVAVLNDDQSLQEVFKATAMALISKVGGASGPLYGTAFMEMAKVAATSDDLSSLLAAGLAGIIKRGGAQVGDRGGGAWRSGSGGASGAYSVDVESALGVALAVVPKLAAVLAEGL